MNFNELNQIISKNKTKIDEESLGTFTTPIAQNAPANNQISGNINFQRLLKYFPNQDPVRFKNSVSIAMRGGKLNNIQLMNLGNAFIDLLKANPRDTMQVMNLIKKVSMEAGEGEQ